MVGSITFDSGSAVKLSTRRHTQPYDPDLRFNRMVHKQRNRPTSVIFSFDAAACIEAIEADRLRDLYRVTLAGQRGHHGVGAWDIFFNSSHVHPISACVLFAQADYKPIPPARVSFSSSWMNLSHPVTRLHLNQVVVGDRIGVAMRHKATRITYILLYVVEEFCTVQLPEGERGKRIPALNLRMEHALRVLDDGNGISGDMEENGSFDAEKAQPFITWLFETVYNVTKSYSWKPHFVPWIPPEQLDPVAVTERLGRAINSTRTINADEFDKICRDIHVRNNERRRTPPVNRNTSDDPSVRKPKAEIKQLPVVEIAMLEEHAIVTFRDSPTVYQISKEELNRLGDTERHLTNADLKYVDLKDVTNFLVLSNDVLGKNVTVRYFTMNF